MPGGHLEANHDAEYDDAEFELADGFVSVIKYDALFGLDAGLSRAEGSSNRSGSINEVAR